MQMVNALNDPRNAMTVENSGIAIDTAIEAAAESVRLRTRFGSNLCSGV